MEVEKYVDSLENEIYLDTVSRIDAPQSSRFDNKSNDDKPEKRDPIRQTHDLGIGNGDVTLGKNGGAPSKGANAEDAPLRSLEIEKCMVVKCGL